MKLIIAGGREITEQGIIERALKLAEIEIKTISSIIQGGSRGVDWLAITFARRMNIPFVTFHANWNKRGLAAGPIRNKEMAKHGDRLLAIWDGKSKGTKNMINAMDKAGKPHFIYYYEKI